MQRFSFFALGPGPAPVTIAEVIYMSPDHDGLRSWFAA